MAQVIKSITLPGWDRRLRIQTLTIRQYYDQHHSFELTALVPQDADLTIGGMKAILGERVDIRIRLADGEESSRFLGFVDRVTPTWTAHGRALQVEGYSPSVFLDIASRFRVFSETSLGAVVDQVMDQYPAAFQRSGGGDQVPFSVQAQETDYNYLCRLADAYQKVFYYDGETMRFGQWEEQPASEAIRLDVDGRELKEAELMLNTAPLHFRLNGYRLEENRQLSTAVQAQYAAHPLVGAAVGKSSCYPFAAIQLPHLVSNENDLTGAAKSVLARQAHDLVRLTGRSACPALRIGSRIRLVGGEELLCNSDYIVIQLLHRVDSDNSYHNTFTAVPAGCPYPVRMQRGRSPVSGPLMAIVRDTGDPQQLGRVKVEFLGDELRSHSPWLRVLVPYTAHGGMHFLPEKGDQVVVFAEDFNAEKLPFVMGAFYHGDAKAETWSDPDHRKKGFVTNKIRFLLDDNSGKLTIEANEIELKASSSIQVDGGSRLVQKASRIDLNP